MKNKKLIIKTKKFEIEVGQDQAKKYKDLTDHGKVTTKTK